MDLFELIEVARDCYSVSALEVIYREDVTRFDEILDRADDYNERTSTLLSRDLDRLEERNLVIQRGQDSLNARYSLTSKGINFADELYADEEDVSHLLTGGPDYRK